MMCERTHEKLSGAAPATETLGEALLAVDAHRRLKELAEDHV